MEVTHTEEGTIGTRVVAHLDMDCFFVQVERQQRRELMGKPVAVQQHDDLISVSYEARALGVKKHMSPSEALNVCPDLVLVHVRRNAGTSKVTYEDYHNASAALLALVKELLPLAVVEKASIDDLYIDLSPLVGNELPPTDTQTQSQTSSALQSSFGEKHAHMQLVYGREPTILSERDRQLLKGANIVSELREAIHRRLGFTSSGGIAQNKLLARLASSQNKPNGQTVLLPCNEYLLLENVPIRSLPQLSRRLGGQKNLEQLLSAVKNLQEQAQEEQSGGRDQQQQRTGPPIASLQRFSQEELASFAGTEERRIEWLLQACRGQDNEAVREKGPPKSILSSMTLTPLEGVPQLRKVVRYIASEMSHRLLEDEQQHGREAQCITFGYRLVDEKEKSQSIPLSKVAAREKALVKQLQQEGKNVDEEAQRADALTSLALDSFLSSNQDKRWRVRWIGFTATKFIKHRQSIASFFASSPTKESEGFAVQPTTAEKTLGEEQKEERPNEVSPSSPSFQSAKSPKRKQPSKASSARDRANKSPQKKGRGGACDKQQPTLLNFFARNQAKEQK
ncbi:N-acetyltransferase eso1 [Balamuthia mandrillaris]